MLRHEISTHHLILDHMKSLLNKLKAEEFIFRLHLLLINLECPTLII